MRIFILLLFTFFSANYCSAQPKVAWDAYHDFVIGTQTIPLFDKEEIKAAKITTAYMVRHPMTWKSPDFSSSKPFQHDCNCSFSDTFAIYKFDEQGRIRELTYIYTESQKVVNKYDSGGKRADIDWTVDTSRFRENKITYKVGNDSLVETTVFLKFRKGLDTAYLVKERFDNRGYLVEAHSTSNKKNNAYFFDNHNGDFDYHHFQNFDDQGRLIYFFDASQKEYQKISYPSFGKVIDTYDAVENKIISSQAAIIGKVGVSEPALSITSGNSATILTYLKKGSRLFKLRSTITFSEFPLIEYEEILYSYQQ